MKKALIAISCTFYLVFSGCSITQTVNPVLSQDLDSREICVIEDIHVNKLFLRAYKTALEKKGLSVRLLSPGSDVDSCPLSSTYLGKWSWDFVPYMAYAEIIVYRNGDRVGDALYKAPRAGWSMTPDIYEETDIKIIKMVDQLFPNIGNSKQ